LNDTAFCNVLAAHQCNPTGNGTQLAARCPAHEDNRASLSVTEAARLAELEPIIQRGMTNFVEVGNALLEISDRRLYRATHSTFQEYVADRWKITARRAYQLCEAAEVVNALPEECVKNYTVNESQARELAKVEPEKRPAVLSTVASKGKLTAKTIREAANPELPQPRFLPETGPYTSRTWCL